ncbi:GNAT family N-acetyltransferase [Pedobacter cryoconitis]|uniref:Acetyltransferase (GNAT) family protein n=1 Tax=Pedobacter cryoconitis TaxID=188932 RepID=A0A327S9E2_9SPHI|nr:GNAT family N-acetyltransferase [Pedobacter cryoconitis]RAJ22387.1 acetyltransferase (GNAT) family protein [Pedobacter cryoconitis]
MEITTLENISIDSIVEVLNQSFSDYIVPLQLNSEQLEFKIFAENVKLNLSVGVFSSGKLIGFMLHGLNQVDGKLSAYNAATGVVPGYRGKGLVGEMYAFLLPELKALGVEQMLLEVIVGNNAGIRAYEKMDYQVNRTLDCFNGAVQTVEKAPVAVIRDLTQFDWDKLTSFWTIKPSWQNSVATLEKSKDRCTAVGAYLNEELIGYLVYNPVSRKIHQIAVSAAHRRKGVATQLVNKMIASIDPKTLSMNNVDTSSPETIAFFKSLGLSNPIAQLEMKRRL